MGCGEPHQKRSNNCDRIIHQRSLRPGSVVLDSEFSLDSVFSVVASDCNRHYRIMMANARCYYRRNTLACPSDCSQLEQYLIVPIKLSSTSWVCWQLSISLSNWPAGVDVYLPSLTAKASSAKEAFIVMTLTSELTAVSTLCAPSPSCCGPFS
jgi:hypothetical protein